MSDANKKTPETVRKTRSHPRTVVITSEWRKPKIKSIQRNRRRSWYYKKIPTFAPVLSDQRNQWWPKGQIVWFIKISVNICQLCVMWFIVLDNHIVAFLVACRIILVYHVLFVSEIIIWIWHNNCMQLLNWTEGRVLITFNFDMHSLHIRTHIIQTFISGLSTEQWYKVILIIIYMNACEFKLTCWLIFCICIFLSSRYTSISIIYKTSARYSRSNH